MYKDGVGVGDVDVPVLDSKYTDYVRRQEVEKMAAAGVTPFKKVTKTNSKTDKDKDNSKSMAAPPAKAKGESKNNLVRTRSVDAVNVAAANAKTDNKARKTKSSTKSTRSGSAADSSRGDSAGTENYRPPPTPDYSSLIKFSQMFNSKESYALQQYEVFKAAHRANYPETKSVDNGYSDESDDEDEEEEEDMPPQPPPPPAGGKGKKDGKESKEKDKGKNSKEKEKEKAKEKDKDKDKNKDKKSQPAIPDNKPPPVPPPPKPVEPPPRKDSNPWQNNKHHRTASDDEDDEDDEGRTIATTSTNNTEASTLADEVSSDILRQELLQNIRAISSTFPDNDMSFNAAVDALTDTYRHRLSILGFENTRRDSQVEGAQEQGGDGGNEAAHQDRPTPSRILPEPIRTGPSDDAEEFLLKSKTPSGKSKSKSIDNWIANSNREINNNLNRMEVHEPEPVHNEVDEGDANLNEHHVKSAGLLGLGKVPPVLLKTDVSPAQPHKYVNITGGTKYQEVKRALEEKLKERPGDGGSSPRHPPFSTYDDSDGELHLTLNRADAINNLHAQNPYANHAHSIGSLGFGSFSSSPVPPATLGPAALAANAMHGDIVSNSPSNVRSLFNKRSSAKAKPKKTKDKKFGNQRLRSSRGVSSDSNNEMASANDSQVRYNLLPPLPPSTPLLIKKRKQQLQELGSRVPGMLRRQNMDQWIAKVVWFYANGDEYGHRHEFRFRPGKDVHDFEGLCDILSTRIGLPRGVRHIFTIDGQPIWSLNQLQHEQSYVVSSTRKFKFMDYTRPSSEALRNGGVLDLSFDQHSSAPLRQSSREASHLRRERSLNDVRHDRERQLDDQMKLYNGHNNVRNLALKSEPSKTIHLPSSVKQQNIDRERKSPTPEVERLVNHAIMQSSQYRAQLRPVERQIILVVNGVNPKIHSQVLLNTRVSQEWEELVKDLGMAVKIPKHYDGVLKTANGKSVMSYSQLRSELRNGNQTYYVFPLKRRFPKQKSRGRNNDETLNNMKHLSLSDSVVQKNDSAIFEAYPTRYRDLRLPKDDGDGYVNNNLTERTARKKPEWN